MQTKKNSVTRNLINLGLTEELGLADEYSARVDIEVDSPGPSHVIQSIPLRARSGTARVHAPKDLQVLKVMHNVSSFLCFCMLPRQPTFKTNSFAKSFLSYPAYILFDNQLPSSLLEQLFLAFLCYFCLDNQAVGSTG